VGARDGTYELRPRHSERAPVVAGGERDNLPELARRNPRGIAPCRCFQSLAPAAVIGVKALPGTQYSAGRSGRPAGGEDEPSRAERRQLSILFVDLVG
jgi:hypothetical protein